MPPPPPGERIGNLTVVQKDSTKTAAIISQMSLLIRGMFSNPPAYGSQIVSRILNTPALKAEWMQSIQAMSSRIIRMRAALYKSLTELKTPGTWEHIIEQIGMFSYTGMNGKALVGRRRRRWSVAVTAIANDLSFVVSPQRCNPRSWWLTTTSIC